MIHRQSIFLLPCFRYITPDKTIKKPQITGVGLLGGGREQNVDGLGLPDDWDEKFWSRGLSNIEYFVVRKPRPFFSKLKNIIFFILDCLVSEYVSRFMGLFPLPDRNWTI